MSTHSQSIYAGSSVSYSKSLSQIRKPKSLEKLWSHHQNKNVDFQFSLYLALCCYYDYLHQLWRCSGHAGFHPGFNVLPKCYKSEHQTFLDMFHIGNYHQIYTNSKNALSIFWEVGLKLKHLPSSLSRLTPCPKEEENIQIWQIGNSIVFHSMESFPWTNTTKQYSISFTEVKKLSILKIFHVLSLT